MVDDHENDILLTKLGLKRAGLTFPIHSVTGGLQAIAFLNGDPPYQDRARYPLPFLVLLDIKMPQVDGFEVLRWIRRQPQFADLPVVMLTGSGDSRQADTARQLGATSCFVKSFDLTDAAELSGSIKRLMVTPSPPAT